MAYIKQVKRGTDRITVCVCSSHLLRSVTLGTADENSAELSQLVADAELVKAHLDSRFTKHQETLFATVLPDRLASLVEPLVKPYPYPFQHLPAPAAQNKENQQQLPPNPVVPVGPAATAATPPVPDPAAWLEQIEEFKTSQKYLWALLRTAYRACGLEEIEHTNLLSKKQAVALRQMALARLIWSGSKKHSHQTLLSLGNIGEPVVSLNTMYAALDAAGTDQVREYVFNLFLEHAASSGEINFVFFNVITLYFEIDHADDENKGRRAPGYSKKRRIDPQIKVGMFTDPAGRCLYLEAFNGADGEVNTFLPILDKFIAKTQISDITIVADSGMISYANLVLLDKMGFKFIIGSKKSRIPYDLAFMMTDGLLEFTEDQVVDSITPRHGNGKARAVDATAGKRWDPEVDRTTFRAVWRCSSEYRRRSLRAIDERVAKARQIIANPGKARRTAYVGREAESERLFLKEQQIAIDRSQAGLKGYVTNIPASVLSAKQVVAAYHNLWHIEQHFKMAKSDLRARPIFHSLDRRIEGHLVVVGLGLVVADWLQEVCGVSAKRVVAALRPVTSAEIVHAGRVFEIDPLRFVVGAPDWAVFIKRVVAAAGELVF